MITRLSLAEPSFLALTRWPFYILELGLRMSSDIYWSAWYWMPLDIWADYHCSGNSVTFTPLRWMKTCKNSVSRSISILAVVGYYFMAQYFDPIDCYFGMVILMLLIISYLDNRPKIDIQVGTIRVEDINNALTHSKDWSNKMMKGMMTSFFDEDEATEMMEMVDEMTTGQDNMMGAMFKMFMPPKDDNVVVAEPLPITDELNEPIDLAQLDFD